MNGSESFWGYGRKEYFIGGWAGATDMTSMGVCKSVAMAATT